LIKRKRKGTRQEHVEQRQPFNSYPSNEVKGQCLSVAVFDIP
jgi:hypothetical protein